MAARALVPERGIFYWLYRRQLRRRDRHGAQRDHALAHRRRARSRGSCRCLILPFPMTFVYAIFGLKLFDDYAAVQTHSGRVLRKVRAAKTKILDQPATEEWPVLANVSQLPFLSGQRRRAADRRRGDVRLDLRGHLAGREGAADPVLHHQRRRAREASSPSG